MTPLGEFEIVRTAEMGDGVLCSVCAEPEVTLLILEDGVSRIERMECECGAAVDMPPHKIRIEPVAVFLCR